MKKEDKLDIIIKNQFLIFQILRNLNTNKGLKKPIQERLIELSQSISNKSEDKSNV